MTAPTIRRLETRDIATCSGIFFRGFLAVSSAHGLPPEFGSEKEAQAYLLGRMSMKETVGFVAESEGRIMGFRLIDQRAKPIAALGPLVVDPELGGQGVGRALIANTQQHLTASGFQGARLVQAAYNFRSMQLFCSSGFEVREPLLSFSGRPPSQPNPDVRLATNEDVPACEALHAEIHGFSRTLEFQQGIKFRTAVVYERQGSVVAFASAVGSGGYAAARTSEDLSQLLGAATRFFGHGVLVPARNTELVQWCLRHSLRITRVMILMTSGMYQEPRGAYLPSVLF